MDSWKKNNYRKSNQEEKQGTTQIEHQNEAKKIMSDNLTSKEKSKIINPKIVCIQESKVN